MSLADELISTLYNCSCYVYYAPKYLGVSLLFGLAVWPERQMNRLMPCSWYDTLSIIKAYVTSRWLGLFTGKQMHSFFFDIQRTVHRDIFL